MKRTFYAIVMVALFAMSFAPVLAQTETVDTGLTRDTSGGATPIVKAKWEANISQYVTGVAGTQVAIGYADDSTSANAQFNPTGVFEGNRTFTICAVVTDPDGLADIDNVYADVFYPTGIALGSSHVALPGQPQNPANQGCGKFMQEDTLKRLSKADGIALFCNSVKNSNNNLPTFNDGYDYAEICAADGELQKDTAAVYCGEKTISYEDPSGDYKVWAIGQDKNGLQGTLENYFTYVPVTAFETDFTSVAYGNVRLNTEKIISGDLTWDVTPVKATVRNTGNTRLAMTVQQDDMGLGQTSGVWNVSYRARVGSASSYATYLPDAPATILDNALDLSEKDEMDFAVTITKFPPTNPGPDYTGTMTLSAIFQSHLNCGT